eukprot:scaffold59653_cov23-Cyclotella_meneghiniana.AAC.1
MPSETKPIYDEESPAPVRTRFELPEDEARRFYNTPASSAGGLHNTSRRISTDFSSTPANQEQRRREQLRRQQQFQQPSILRTPGHFSMPLSTHRNRFPLPSQRTPTSSSRDRTQHDFHDGIRVTGLSSDTDSDQARQRSRAIISASPQKSKFVPQDDNDVCAVNVRVALRKEDYGEPGSSEYRKNMAAATYPLPEKFGGARHKVLSSAEEGDETKSRFVQQVLVGLTHRVKEGHGRSKKFDFMDICTLADYSGNVSSPDCLAWWGDEEINIWTDWEQISETHAQAWQHSINLRFSDKDLTASLWLKEFIYNSCTDSLRTAIEKKFDKVPLEQQGGITYLWYCLDEMFTMSREVQQAMLDYIALFKRRGVARYTGENVMVVEEELNNAKFKGIFIHLLSNAELDCLALVLPTIPHNPTPLETLEAVLQKAYDMYDTLNIAGSWIKINNRTTALNTIVVKRNCWNCGDEGHGVSDCPKPRDEATITKNRNEFMQRRSNNSVVVVVKEEDVDLAVPEDAEVVEEAVEMVTLITKGRPGKLKVSRYHSAWASNPSTFRLPDNNVYGKACQALSGTAPKPPPPNPPSNPPPSQPPGQNPSGQAGSLVLDRASLESKMSQYERTSTDPNASSIGVVRLVSTLPCLVSVQPSLLLLLFDRIHPSPVLVVPDRLAPATVASGGDIYTTIWFVAVILAVAKLCHGLIVHVNIGVGGGESTARDRGTVSNAIS